MLMRKLSPLLSDHYKYIERGHSFSPGNIEQMNHSALYEEMYCQTKSIYSKAVIVRAHMFTAENDFSHSCCSEIQSSQCAEESLLHRIQHKDEQTLVHSNFAPLTEDAFGSQRIERVFRIQPFRPGRE